jgi:hypothetical protein
LSEYQYYEFLAVDRPLDQAAQAKLRAISTRARITATSFANHYEWGDLKADPMALLAAHFDLHVYVANWGSRTFAMRVPAALVDRSAIERFNISDELLTLKQVGEHLLIHIAVQEVDSEGWDGGEQWLAGLAPLRASVLAGDLRLFYLLWLLQVSYEDFVPDDTPEPLAFGTPDGALTTFAEFIDLNPDLLSTASTVSAQAASMEPDAAAVQAAIRGLDDDEKTHLLAALYADDDPHLVTKFRRRLRSLVGRDAVDSPGRSAGTLREAAVAAMAERVAAAAAREAAERRQREAEAAAARAARVTALRRRGEEVWQEVEGLIEQRNARGYQDATALLLDLREIAPDYVARLLRLRGRHASKRSFIARLDAAGLA